MPTFPGSVKTGRETRKNKTTDKRSEKGRETVKAIKETGR
jgi:hypothetical protein